jgi:hypothetical protein
MFLAGTFNKILEYGNGIYAELHHQFYRSLRDTTRLVVCGYGFGDKVINSRIVEWLYAFADNLVIIVDPRPAELKKSARWELASRWDYLEQNGKLSFVPRGIECVTWGELKALLNA